MIAGVGESGDRPANLDENSAFLTLTLKLEFGRIREPDFLPVEELT